MVISMFELDGKWNQADLMRTTRQMPSEKEPMLKVILF